MKKIERVKKSFVALILVISMLCPTYGCIVSADTGSLYETTTKALVSDSINYLNEVYLKKYPELGLTIYHGTMNEKAILKKLADIITKNAKTDKQKADAIYDWIVANIKFYAEASAYSMDTFYSRKGNCVSNSNLMADLLKLSGVKCAVIFGYGEDMTKLKTIEKITAHGWVMAYVDSKWTLYDTTKKIKACTDIKEMAKKYYFCAVDYVYAKSLKENKFFGTQIVYDNGFKVMTDKEETPDNVGNFYNNVPICAVTNGYVYSLWNGKAPTYGDEGKDAIFNQEGWRQGFGQYLYSYRNGLMANNVEMQIEGENYLVNDWYCYKVFAKPDDYYYQEGNLYFKKGYKGKMIMDYYAYNVGEKNGTLSYESSNENVVKVLENNELECVGNGISNIYVSFKISNVETVRLGYTVRVSNGRPAPNYSDNRELRKLRNTGLKVSKPKIKSLKNEKKKITVKWNKVSNAKGYEVKYALNKKFTKKLVTKKVKKNRITLKKLKKNKKYYVKVRAYTISDGEKVWSKWSKIKCKKVKK